jgi:dihydrolipoamide dehydrogenase
VDAALTRPVARRLKDLKVSVVTSAHARGLTRGGEGLLIEQRGCPLREIPADKILVAVGREPCTKGFGLERLSLAMEGKFVKIDRRCETSMSNVWAIGDLTGEPMLAHRAMQAKAEGLDIKVATFPFAANGRALTQMNDEGFVRIIARVDDHLVLGGQAVGAGVSELTSSLALAIEMGAVLEDVAGTIGAHPTRSEAIQRPPSARWAAACISNGNKTNLKETSCILCSGINSGAHRVEI